MIIFYEVRVSRTREYFLLFVWGGRRERSGRRVAGKYYKYRSLNTAGI